MFLSIKILISDFLIVYKATLGLSHAQTSAVLLSPEHETAGCNKSRQALRRSSIVIFLEIGHF